MTSRTRQQTFTLIRRRTIRLAERFDLTLAVTDLDHIDPLFLTAAQRMQDARPGLPGAQAYDAPSVSGGSSKATHPERMAEQTDRTEPDRALLDQLLHDLASATDPAMLILDGTEYARLITRDCLTLRRLIDAWSPHRPSPKDLRTVEVANAAPVDCEHHTTAGIFEPMHCFGTVGGNLDLPMRLCLACHNQVRRNGKLPSGEWMERRRRTGKDDKERV